MSGRVRGFLAVELPEAVREALWRECGALRELPVRVSWTPPERMHLTLVFLKEIAEERVETVAGVQDEVCEGIPPFTFRVEGVGAFGSARHPSVVWAGIPDPPDDLMRLQTGLKEGVRAKEFEVSGKAFRPHITLGRVRSMKGVAQLTSAIASANNVEFGIVPVRRVLLVQSHLEPGGVRYENLRESGLKGS